jgi:excisionase family DNA binding protein
MELCQIKDRSTVWKWRQKGMPFIRLGGSIRFEWDEVKEWMKKRGEGKTDER